MNLGKSARVGIVLFKRFFSALVIEVESNARDRKISVGAGGNAARQGGLA
jgi:hypothetical protein